MQSTSELVQMNEGPQVVHFCEDVERGVDGDLGGKMAGRRMFTKCVIVVLLSN